jgi:hypothetical protein
VTQLLASPLSDGAKETRFVPRIESRGRDFEGGNNVQKNQFCEALALRHQRSVLAVVCAIGAASSALAQTSPSLTGTYSGTFTSSTRSGPIPISVQLDIDHVDGDAITATAKQSRGGCKGSYSLDGRREHDHLVFHTKSQDALAGCTFDLDLTIQGEELVGKKGQADIKLSR